MIRLYLIKWVVIVAKIWRFSVPKDLELQIEMSKVPEFKSRFPRRDFVQY